MRQPFSCEIYVLAQAALLALHFPTTRTLPRTISFVVLAGALFYIHVYLTLFSPGEDYVLGASNGILLCIAIHVAFLDADFPDRLRRAREDDSSKLPSEFLFRQKLGWMLDLGTNVRRIGWISTHKKREHTPSPSASSRWLFVFSRILLATLYLFIFQVTAENRSRNPSFDPQAHDPGDKLYIRRKMLFLRGIDVSLWALGVAAEMSFIQTLAAAISVGFGFYSPEDWPSLTGSPLDAFTVKGFWNKTWHQILRVPLQGYGKFVAHRLLKLKRGTGLSAYVQAVTAFFVSAAVHMAGDYSIHNTYGPTLRFFLLQPVAIAFEDVIIRLFRSFRFDSRIWRLVGYIWVYMWFSWCAPPWLDSISAHGGNMRTKVVMFKLLEFVGF